MVPGALVAGGAAVTSVFAAHGLGHLAAAPLLRLLVEAAGIAILAAGVVVTWVHKLRPRLLRLLHPLHRLSGSHRHHHHGGLLAPHGRGLRPAVAGVGGEVAGGAGGAAVLMVGAADRLWQWAAGPAAQSVLAAGLGVRAAMRGVAHHLPRPQRWEQRCGAESGNLAEQRHRGGTAFVAGAVSQVARGAVWAAVDVILTADGLCQRTAAPRPCCGFTAGAAIRTESSRITPDHSFSDARASIGAASEASGTAELLARDASGTAAGLSGTTSSWSEQHRQAHTQ